METTPESQGGDAAEHKTFNDILHSLIGQVVTVVNPESFEHAPIGHQLKPGFYRAKVTEMATDYLTLITELKKPGKRGQEDTKEPVKQFLPIGRIKRISLTKGDRMIHL
jgi:hypothetical protein